MKKSVVVTFHIIFWVVIFLSYLLLPFVTGYLPPEEFGQINNYTFLSQPFIFYLSYFGIMYLTNKRERVLYVVLFFIGLYFLLVFLSVELFIGGLYILAKILIWAFLGGIFRFFIDWFKKREIQQQLEEQNLKSEIALLRTQINPHFLFNTLYNILMVDKNSLPTPHIIA